MTAPQDRAERNRLIAIRRGCHPYESPAQYPFDTPFVWCCGCPAEEDGTQPHGGRNGFIRVLIDFHAPEWTARLLEELVADWRWVRLVRSSTDGYRVTMEGYDPDAAPTLADAVAAAWLASGVGA